MRTGLKQHESEQIMTDLHFWVNYPSKTNLRPLLIPGIEKKLKEPLKNRERPWAAKRTITFDWTENGDATDAN